MSRAIKWETDDRKAIADVCHRLYERNYLVATSGNVSVRTDGGFLITPATTRKDAVDESSIVECNMAGLPIKPGKRPSSETAMHREAYMHRPDVGAAIHAHPHYCLACALAGIDMETMTLPELAIYIGPVPLVPYATPGTAQMAEVLQPYLKKHNAFLLNRHGVLVLGEDLMDAYNRLEHLEHMARIAHLVSSTGSIEPLTKAEIRKISKEARKIGQKITSTILDILE
jgi:L-fuculose-phosphate aldolase